MTAIEQIDAFLEEWPDAEFGPAHIVLSDHNLADCHIRWCQELARSALSFVSSPEDRQLLDDVDWYRRQDRDEMAATIVFLNQLLTIPEAEREREVDDEL